MPESLAASFLRSPRGGRGPPRGSSPFGQRRRLRSPGPTRCLNDAPGLRLPDGPVPAPTSAGGGVSSGSRSLRGLSAIARRWALALPDPLARPSAGDGGVTPRSGSAVWRRPAPEGPELLLRRLAAGTARASAIRSLTARAKATPCLHALLAAAGANALPGPPLAAHIPRRSGHEHRKRGSSGWRDTEYSRRESELCTIPVAWLPSAGHLSSTCPF